MNILATRCMKSRVCYTDKPCYIPERGKSTGVGGCEEWVLLYWNNNTDEGCCYSIPEQSEFAVAAGY